MAEKVTVMVLKVDLQCSCCYKKIKKLLCQFPQIRDQMYDDKQNQVIITVVCCSPEKIRDKLCCKGGKLIERIDIIKEPPNPHTNHNQEENLGEQKQSNKPELHLCLPIHVEVEYRYPPYRGRGCCGLCSEGYLGGLCYYEHKRPFLLPPQPPYLGRRCCGPCSEGFPGGPCYHDHERPSLPPPQPPYPGRGCCGPCSEGYPGGPCYHEHERPTLPPPSPPQPSYKDYVYGDGKGYHVSRCDYYLSEENPQGCTIM